MDCTVTVFHSLFSFLLILSAIPGFTGSTEWRESSGCGQSRRACQILQDTGECMVYHAVVRKIEVGALCTMQW